MRHRPNGDASVAASRINVVEIGRAISLPITARIAEQARCNVGEVVGAIVVPIVAMRAARLRAGGSGATEEAEQQDCADEHSHADNPPKLNGQCRAGRKPSIDNFKSRLRPLPKSDYTHYGSGRTRRLPMNLLLVLPVWRAARARSLRHFLRTGRGAWR